MNYNANNKMYGICPTCKSTIWVNPRNSNENCPVCHNHYNTQYAIGYYNSVNRNNQYNFQNPNNSQFPQRFNNQQRSTRLIPAICPQCHGQVQLNPGCETAVCQFCGTRFLVDKSVNNYYNVNNTNIHNQAKKGAVESFFNYRRQKYESMMEDSRRNRERLNEIISDPKKLRNFIIFFCAIIGIPVLLMLIPALLL